MIIGVKKSSENQKERNVMGGVAWTEEEDDLLRKCIEQYGEGKWHRVPLLAGLNRCRKSCRLRWLNYLRPNIRRGKFTDEEVKLIIKLHNLLGNRWSLIAGQLRGRTANDVKNFWNCHLSKTFENPHQDHTTATSSSKEEKQQTADTPETSTTSGSAFEDLMKSSLLSSFPEKKKKTTKLPSSFNGSEITAGVRSQATSNVPITAHGHEYEYGRHLDNQHICMCKDNQSVVLASSSLDNVRNLAVPYNGYATIREHCDCTDINSKRYYIDDQGNKEENRGSKYHHEAISPEKDELIVNFEFDEIKMCGEQRKISKWDLDDLMIMDMDLWGNQALL